MDELIFLSVVLILLIQLVYEFLKLFLLLLHVDGVSFKIIMLLLLENLVKFLVKTIDYIFQIFLVSVNFLVLVDLFILEPLMLVK